MLFKDIITLKKYAALSGDNDIDDFTASLRMVENLYIIPVLGKEQYNALDTELKAAAQESDLAEVYIDLLHQCRMVIGPMFCYHHADKADVMFSSGGMKRTESSTNKVAYQEQRTKFKEANLNEGENAIELLIQFLEENIQNYEAWKDSPTFTKYRSMFIKTGSEFNEYFPSHSPYRNYWAMRTKMYDVEQLNIRPFLGNTLFKSLKDKAALVEPAFSEKEEELLTHLKKSIANLTVAFAVPLLNVRISSNGLTVAAATNFSTSDSENTRSGVADNAFSLLINSCTGTGTDWLNKASIYLSEHKTEFPDWIGFATPTTTETEESCNHNRGGAFGLM